jgi:hypothetical protein
LGCGVEAWHRWLVSWSVSTEKIEFGHVLAWPPRAWGWAGRAVRRSSAACLMGGDVFGPLLVFVSVNQVLVRLWACRGQPV